MAKINNLKIENFDPFERIEFNFVDGLNVITGGNSSGKSRLAKVLSNYAELKIWNPCEYFGNPDIDVIPLITYNNKQQITGYIIDEDGLYERGFALNEEELLRLEGSEFEAISYIYNNNGVRKVGKSLSLLIKDIGAFMQCKFEDNSTEKDGYNPMLDVYFSGNKYISELSLTQKKLTTLATCLYYGNVREGSILILDDFLNGMDSKHLKFACEFLSKLVNNGVQVFLTMTDEMMLNVHSYFDEVKDECKTIVRLKNV